MSRFSGPQRQRAGRDERAVKRTEAEERNARTPAERRRWHREGRAEPVKGNAR